MGSRQASTTSRVGLINRIVAQADAHALVLGARRLEAPERANFGSGAGTPIGGRSGGASGVAATAEEGGRAVGLVRRAGGAGGFVGAHGCG